MTGKRFEHPFDPVFDKNSTILILGTFPSVKSREGGFYYLNPQNRFWRLIARLTGTTPVPAAVEGMKSMLLAHGIALWDVVKSCEISASSDSSIKNVIPADLSVVLDGARVRRIFANGAKAYDFYMRYCREKTGREIIKLPSTSPANAAWSFEKLAAEWSRITEYFGREKETQGDKNHEE